MPDKDNPIPRTDLEHDLSRLMECGKDAVDVVVFQDIRCMGAPLALSDATRHHIYQLALQDLYRQLGPRQVSANA